MIFAKCVCELWELVRGRTLIQDFRKVLPQPKDSDRSFPVPSGMTAT